MQKQRELLRREFLMESGIQFNGIEPLKGDASQRKYYRIFNKNENYILMDSPQSELPGEFIKIAKWLQSIGLSAPSIISANKDMGFILMEDYGDELFSKVLKGESEYSQDFSEEKLYQRAIDVLIHLHKQSTTTVQLKPYSKDIMLKELDLFIEWYVSILNGYPINTNHYQYFQDFWDSALDHLAVFPNVVVLKDYHIDNLILLPKKPGIERVGLLDFQDAIIGSPMYDLASLLEDARRDVSEDITQFCITRYNQGFPEYAQKDILIVYSIMAMQRNLRIVGTFSKLAINDHKTQYLNYLPRLWKYIHKGLNLPTLSPLKDWFDMVLPNHFSGLDLVNNCTMSDISSTQ